MNRSTLVLACFVSTALACGIDAEPVPQHTETSFEVEGRLVELRVFHDQVGVVFDEDEHDGSGMLPVPLIPAGATHTPPAQDATGLHEVLHLVDPAGITDGDELADAAHELLALNADALDHAGVVVQFKDSNEVVLMTHEIVVQFVDAATDAEITALLTRMGLHVGRRSPFRKNLFVVETPPESDDDALEACALLSTEPLVDYCEPNFVHAVEYLSNSELNDPLLHMQWHHSNDGRGQGSFDADIDTVEAWGITKGSSDVVIAVLEDGFDVTHPDLVGNLWSSDDVPPVHGHNFENKNSDVLGEPLDHDATAHGTAVAGCAGAQGGNGIGVSGSSPECSLMLLRRASPSDYMGDAEAIHYAWTNGADILTNSWTYGVKTHVPQCVKEAIEEAMTKGRDGKGSIVVFSTRNKDIDVNAIDDVAALAGVLTVGSVTNTDERTRACGSGPCLDVLGPSRLSQSSNFTEGTLNVVTTDWSGFKVGYNHDTTILPTMDEDWPACSDVASDGNYTACFGGTSAATPIVAGVVGLVLSVAPELEREEVIRLMCDTTDRVQHSAASYLQSNGRSKADSHGYGRVNAFEAVRVVAPTSLGGRAGVDVFVRDHMLDWGNTERPSSFLFERQRGTTGVWTSPDILVQAAPLSSAEVKSADFDAPALERVALGKTNRVSVRVRNRGPKSSGAVSVTVLWTEAVLALPNLPFPFWNGTNPGDTVPSTGAPGTWRSLGSQSIPDIPNSAAASLKDGGTDTAQILSFDFVAPAATSAETHDDFAFLVLINRPSEKVGQEIDPYLEVYDLVALDNNVALSNRLILSPDVAIPLSIDNLLDQMVDMRVDLKGTDLTGLQLKTVNKTDKFNLGGPITMSAKAKIPLEVTLSGSSSTAEVQLLTKGGLVGGATLFVSDTK